MTTWGIPYALMIANALSQHWCGVANGVGVAPIALSDKHL